MGWGCGLFRRCMYKMEQVIKYPPTYTICANRSYVTDHNLPMQSLLCSRYEGGGGYTVLPLCFCLRVCPYIFVIDFKASNHCRCLEFQLPIKCRLILYITSEHWLTYTCIYLVFLMINYHLFTYLYILVYKFTAVVRLLTV